jgi:hypothetical protein
MINRKRMAVEIAREALEIGGVAEAVSAYLDARGSDAETFADLEELRTQREGRAKRYGIGVKGRSNLTPPQGYPANPAEYGDPVNLRYPADAAHARAALGYFNQDGQREAGGYSGEEWAIIGKRLAKLVSRHLRAGYEYRDGKLQQKED